MLVNSQSCYRYNLLQHIPNVRVRTCTVESNSVSERVWNSVVVHPAAVAGPSGSHSHGTRVFIFCALDPLNAPEINVGIGSFPKYFLDPTGTQIYIFFYFLYFGNEN
eukprot:jgi/Psemu1/310503/fgenesh1_kg.646_\